MNARNWLKPNQLKIYIKRLYHHQITQNGFQPQNKKIAINPVSLSLFYYLVMAAFKER